jgi:hypothetical protein
MNIEMNRRALIRTEYRGVCSGLFDFIRLYGNLATVYFAFADLCGPNQIKCALTCTTAHHGKRCTRRGLSRWPQFGCLHKRHEQETN